MTNVGWSLKLTSMWHRAVASYLRAVAAILGTLTIAADLSFLSNLGWSLLGALIPPAIVFITEAADLLDEVPPSADPAP